MAHQGNATRETLYKHMQQVVKFLFDRGGRNVMTHMLTEYFNSLVIKGAVWSKLIDLEDMLQELDEHSSDTDFLVQIAELKPPEIYDLCKYLSKADRKTILQAWELAAVRRESDSYNTEEARNFRKEIKKLPEPNFP